MVLKNHKENAKYTESVIELKIKNNKNVLNTRLG